MKKVTIFTLLLFCCVRVGSQNYLLTANACFDTGDYENAKKNYTLFQLLDGSKDVSAQIRNAEECFRATIVADNYFKERKWTEARNQYRAVLERNPKDPKAQRQYELCTADYFANYTETGNNLNLEMIAVDGGSFTMGASDNDADCFDWEKPAHRVTVSDFYIGKYEVTQAQWKAIMGTNPSRFKGDNLPVERVKWNDIQEFIRKLNARTGKRYRLPSEAEWAYAARGGNKNTGYKYSGNNTIGNVAWYSDNSNNTTHPVGSKSPNELGIYDMSGNVFECCNDLMGPYSSDSQTDPQGPLTGINHVVRGGSWVSDPKYVRVSYRYYYPVAGESDVGFRLACSSE